MQVVAQLRDIHGPDPVGWWPVAPGWWVVLASILVLFWLRWVLRRRRARGWRDWRHDAGSRLRGLSKEVSKRNAKAVVGELSELLRRIAIVRFGRDACAGLAGQEWLAWLKQHDPAGFDWTIHGQVLLDLPYAPASTEVSRQDLMRLVKAVRRWVRSAPSPRKERRRERRRLKALRKATRRSAGHRRDTPKSTGSA